MLIIVVALPAEARSIINRFAMKQLARAGSLRVYGAGDEKLRTAGLKAAGPEAVGLVVSGIGKAATARAVEFADEFFSDAPARAWLNVGICGHRDCEVGSAWLASSIEDAESGERRHPHPIKVKGLAGLALRTVDRPESDYPDGALYDMEASGFCEAAMRLASVELVQCIKVVSDNLAERIETVNAAKIGKLIENRMNEIEAAAAELNDMAAEVGRARAKPALLDRVLGQWRFTQTERHQVEKVLRRLAALGDPAPAGIGTGIGELLDRATGNERGSELLANLRNHVEGLALESDLSNSESDFKTESDAAPADIDRASP